MQVDVKLLDTVIEQTIHTVEKSKQQIYEIADQARNECNTLRLELDKVNKEVHLLIQKSEELGKDARRARAHLSHVSQNFKKYSEEQIRLAYENANKIQVDLSITYEKEIQLRKQRDDLQVRLRNLERTVEKAENLTAQIGVVSGYLAGEIKQVGQFLEDAQLKHEMGINIIQAQEDERKRVAREIHDGPAQSMANVALRIELAEKMLLQDMKEKVQEELKELKSAVRSSLAEVRDIIYNLRPMALDDLGLVPTLQKYLESLSQKTNINIQFKTFGKETSLSGALKIAVFRLVQESLNNIIKHSQAREADIKMEFQRQAIYLIIKDNGIGFDVQSRKKGYGILGMQERVKLLDGDVIIQSQPNKGTRIILTIPIHSTT